MKISIIIPHYKNGKMTAYSISQILKYKGDNELQIIVIDNNCKDGSVGYLKPFMDKIELYNYPPHQIQSHGIAIDFAMEYTFVEGDYILILENDSFPIVENFLDFYKPMIEGDYDISGSFLQLSGGFYIHPNGTLYSKQVYRECLKYVKTIPYRYLPNSCMVDGFENHVMIHDDIWEFFLQKPSAFVNLPDSCKRLSIEDWKEKECYYLPIAKGVFHNGMGGLKETLSTYGQRNLITGTHDVITINGLDKIIPRMGYEPGQFLSYWAMANGKKIAEIGIETKWLPGRENQQQEYTLMESGIKHIWGVSSYMERPAKGVEDIYKEKRKLSDKLYNSLPDNEKIPD